MRIWIYSLSVLFAAAALGGPASAAPRIGVASVVKNQVTGSIGGGKRTLNRGMGVFQNEVVTTGENSSAQLMFLDETTLTLSAKARIVLDKFVYNPKRSSGDIVFNVVKGAFRFVTGSADPNSYKIKTPVATLAIRGTIVEGYIDTSGNAVFVVVEGAITVSVNGQTILVNAGSYVVVTPSGQVIQGGNWTGPILDLDAGVQFIFDNQGRLLDRGGDVLPKWNNLNDALDSRDVDLNFPSDPTGGRGGIDASPPKDDYYLEGGDGIYELYNGQTIDRK